MACWPREQAERRRLLGGDGATTVEVTGKGAQEGRRMTEKVVAQTVGRRGARNGGDTTAASSTMVDVAARGVTARESKEGRVREAW